MAVEPFVFAFGAAFDVDDDDDARGDEREEAEHDDEPAAVCA